MKNIASTILFLLFALWGVSQTFTGKVIDSSTHNAIAFVNIGILNGNNGTVSTENGSFTLTLNNAKDNDTLGLSLIGYRTRFISIPDFRKLLSQNQPIYLSRLAYQLSEVEIRPRVIMKYATLGHVSQSSVTLYNDSNKLGYEIGKEFKVKKPSTFIDSIGFYITDNKCDTAMFRVNIYTYKSGGLFSSGSIGENILKQNVIAKTSVKNGFVYVDLSKYNIRVDNDFVVSLEWIKDYGIKAFGFSGSLFGGLYMRYVSQGPWGHISIATMEMAAMVCYPK